MIFPTVEDLRRHYAGRDVDGDLGYTIHVSKVRELIERYYNMGQEHSNIRLDLLDIVKALLEHIPRLEISRDTNGEVFVDLQTCMKSHAHLYDKGDHFEIAGRYDSLEQIPKNQKIEDILNDIYIFVRYCLHGRDFGSAHWLDLLVKQGLLTVKETVIREYTFK